MKMKSLLLRLSATFLLPASLFAATKPHLLVISLDGMGADYVTKADQYHLKIPTLRMFMAQGVYAQGMTGVLPTMTYPSHTTMMTGVWPIEHGVYNNTQFDPTGALHNAAITESSTMKVKTLWAAAHEEGFTTASVGFPVTTGAPGIDWLFPANAAFEGAGDEGAAVKADSNRHYDHPAGLRETLAPDVAELMGHEDIENRRMAWTIAIIRRYKPDFLTTHIGDLDHAEHAAGPFSEESLKTMEIIDAKVARLIEEERKNYPDAYIMVVSDHGFEPVEKTLHLGVLLHNEGLLPDKGEDWKAALWAAGGTGAILLKDPSDKATEAKVKQVLNQAAANPAYGIDKVYSHAEAQKLGGFPDAAFLIEMKPGFKLGNGRTGKLLADTPHTGTHGYLPSRPELKASFLLLGPSVAHGRNLGMIDMRQVAPTCAQILGLKARMGKLSAVSYKP